MRLEPNRFSVWFSALNGFEPFPWQDRLFREWLCPKEPKDSRWPKLIAVPTACGKTSVIDLAVLALAAGAECARRRIAFVVDRRVVVDEASRRAESIAKKLENALASKKDPLHEVATALRALAGGKGERPLTVSTMRGGIVPDENWARSPVQPAVIVSTVDQVGSRLLFRSYGCGPRSWPVQAGLLGKDTLIVLDEAHCANAFMETLQDIESYWQNVFEVQVGKPLVVVAMTATPLEKPEFELEGDDFIHPEIGKRLKASKPARLILVNSARKNKKAEGSASVQEEGDKEPAPGSKKKDKAAGRMDLIEEMTKKAEELLESKKHRVVGVVVNRVSDAREIHKRLTLPSERKLLLTGRMRDWDRSNLLSQWLPLIRAGTDEKPEESVVVVATQCIEVGANIDFDALVTEIAPLDALRQRFGRLNRLGNHPESEAYIVSLDHQVATKKGEKAEKQCSESASNKQDAAMEAKYKDPIYGHSLPQVWKWLNKNAVEDKKEGLPCIDFKVEGFSMPPKKDLEGMCQERRNAYSLLPAHLDLLAQTSPPSEPDPEISAYLHGTVINNSDVTIVWREDIREEDLESPGRAGRAARPLHWREDIREEDLERGTEVSVWVDRVSVQPPATGEGCPVPIWEFRGWMARGKVEIGGDLEGAKLEFDEKTSESNGLERKVLRWNGPEEAEVVPALEVRPGDVVVVPSSYGGYDTFGWNPQAVDPVEDIGDIVSMRYRRPVLRLDVAIENLRRQGGDEEVIQALDLVRKVVNEEEDVSLREALDEVKAIETKPVWLSSLLDRLLIGGVPKVVSAGGNFALVGRRGLGYDTSTSYNDTSTSYNEIYAGVRVTLEKHSEGVKSLVSKYSKLLGLDEALKRDLELVASFHDLGKADPRFQIWLYEGKEIEYLASGELLAKSALIPRDRISIVRSREVSGYPRGGRHEVQSLALVEKNPYILNGACVSDLVFHLLVSHHGYGRPFVPYIQDENPVTIEVKYKGNVFKGRSDHGLNRLDGGVPERFWSLVRKYGWWGLAYLEAIFRLCDQRQSELEQKEKRNTQEV